MYNRNRLPSLNFTKVAQNVAFPTLLKKLRTFLSYGAEVEVNLDTNTFQTFSREKIVHKFEKDAAQPKCLITLD